MKDHWLWLPFNCFEVRLKGNDNMEIWNTLHDFWQLFLCHSFIKCLHFCKLKGLVFSSIVYKNISKFETGSKLFSSTFENQTCFLSDHICMDRAPYFYYLRNISPFLTTPLSYNPFCTHYYIDPQTNTITSSPDRNTQHIWIHSYELFPVKSSIHLYTLSWGSGLA